MLEFQGLQKTTLIDYPGEVACTLFLGGCNFRCAYCFNPDLALGRKSEFAISKDKALEFLSDRRSFLDGVCVTGGEPLLHNGELKDFLVKTKSLGYKVKLDTNGSFPDRLRDCIDSKLVDYIAMDIKAPLEKYEQVIKSPVEVKRIAESANLVKTSPIAYEFRTTVFTGLNLDDFDSIGSWLSGSRRYCLQPVRMNVPLLDEAFVKEQKSPSLEDLQKIAVRLRSFFDVIDVRP